MLDPPHNGRSLKSPLHLASLGVLGTLPHPLRTHRRSSEARALEQKEKRLGSWLLLQVPPPHKGLPRYTHWQARGTWEPRLALQEQWEKLRGYGLLGPCSSLLQPLPNSGSRLLMLNPQQATYLDSRGPNGARLPLGSS